MVVSALSAKDDGHCALPQLHAGHHTETGADGGAAGAQQAAAGERAAAAGAGAVGGAAGSGAAARAVAAAAAASSGGGGGCHAAGAVAGAHAGAVPGAGQQGGGADAGPAVCPALPRGHPSPAGGGGCCRTACPGTAGGLPRAAAARVCGVQGAALPDPLCCARPCTHRFCLCSGAPGLPAQAQRIQCGAQRAPGCACGRAGGGCRPSLPASQLGCSACYAR